MIGRAILRLSPIALLVLVAACGGGSTRTVTVTVTKTVRSAMSEARVYFLHDGKVAPVGRELVSTNQAGLLTALVAGPTPSEKAAGLTSDMSAGPGSKTRQAQIVYTLTQFDPKSSATVGGNHYTRSDFEDQTPAILVENPLPFARVTSPIRATGTANTFEATFQYEIKDAAGKILAKHFATATSGNGIRGTFDVSIPFTITDAEPATLTVYESSAATGKWINEYAIPLTLAP
jgi:hypothetical protein